MMQALRSMFGSAEGPSLRKSASSARTPATATNRAVRSKNLKKKKKAAPARKSKAASPAAARARNGGGKRDDDDDDDDASFTAGKKMKARKTARPSSSIGKMKAKKATTPRRTSRPRSPVAPPVSAPSKHYVPLATKRTKKAARKPSPAPGTLLPLPGLRLAGFGIQRAVGCARQTQSQHLFAAREEAPPLLPRVPRAGFRLVLAIPMSVLPSLKRLPQPQSKLHGAGGWCVLPRWSAGCVLPSCPACFPLSERYCLCGTPVCAAYYWNSVIQSCARREQAVVRRSEVVQ